jgi:hypothetical protein
LLRGLSKILRLDYLGERRFDTAPLLMISQRGTIATPQCCMFRQCYRPATEVAVAVLRASCGLSNTLPLEYQGIGNVGKTHFRTAFLSMTTVSSQRGTIDASIARSLNDIVEQLRCRLLCDLSSSIDVCGCLDDLPVMMRG